MRTMMKALVGSLLLATLLLPLAHAQTPAPTQTLTPAPAAAGVPVADGRVTLPAGTTLRVRLTTTLTSKTNQTGDQFTGVVDQPIAENGTTIVPEGSQVTGHVAFVKPSKRIKGRAEMRIVLDSVMTPDDVTYPLAASLEDMQGSPCAKTGSDDEGTIKGCGKSKKDAAKNAALGGAIGAGAGATVGMGQAIDCHYYGNCGGPGLGGDVLYGAGIGAGTTLIYNLLKHEKEIILLQGTDLTFTVNRSVQASQAAVTADGPTNAH